MTAYSTFYNYATDTAATTTSFFVLPGTYEIRIPQIVISYYIISETSAVSTSTIGYYTSGASGGSSVAIAPLRQGSPAATATAVSGATGSGTFYQTGGKYAGQFSPTTIASGPPQSEDPGYAILSTEDQYTMPYDFILAPGSALCVTFQGNGDASYFEELVNIQVYFEELRLSWHY